MSLEPTGLSQSAGEATRIFFAYLQAEDAGVAPNRSRILQLHPHLAPLLKEYFNTHDLAKAMPLAPAGDAPADQVERPELPFVVIPAQDARLTKGFEVVEKLGMGGTGTVYRARVTGLTGQPDIAIKLFHYGLNLDVSQRLRDALVLKGLDHPNLVRVYAAGEGMNCGPFLASEYVPGCDLAAWLKTHGPLEERKAAEILRVLAAALHAAHDKDVLHLDIKPDNVFGCVDKLRPEDLKVGDFGLGRFVGEFEAPAADGRSFATGGTTGYMAPEQYWGSSSARSDIYALGTLMLCMVGEPDPFYPERMRARFLNQEQIEALEDLRGPEARLLDIPAKRSRVQELFHQQDIAAATTSIRDPQLRAVIGKCLAIEPGVRYQTAALLAEDLIAWLENRPLTYAKYTYTRTTRFRMLVERCRRGKRLEDHSRLWGMACLVIGSASIIFSTLSTVLIWFGADENVSRWSTSWTFVAIWCSISAWALWATRARPPIRFMFLYTLLYFMSFMVLRLLIIGDANQADAIQVHIAGLLVACIGLGNRYGRKFFYIGMVTIFMSWPVAILLQRPVYAPLGSVIVGCALGLPLLTFGISSRRFGTPGPG